MRILVLNYEYPPLGGGGGIVCEDLSKHLAELGHQLHIVTAANDGKFCESTHGNIRLTRLACHRKRADVASVRDMFSFVLAAKRYLRRQLPHSHYDLCHCHFIVPTGFVAQWMWHQFGIPYIITAHGSDVIGHNPRFSKVLHLIRPLWRSICREAKCVVFPSMYLQGLALSSGQMESVVIPNGIDTSMFHVASKQPIVLCVARLTKNKGVQDLIRALPEGYEQWKLVVIGEGPARSELEMLARRSSWNIAFLGGLSRKEIAKWYSVASVFALPSYFENLSTVLLEAGASGCRLVAYDVGGNREITQQFLASDFDDLKKKIRTALDNDIKNDFPANRFTWKTIAKQYGELYACH